MTFFQNKRSELGPPRRVGKQKPRAPPESQCPGGDKDDDKWCPLGFCDSGEVRVFLVGFTTWGAQAGPRILKKGHYGAPSKQPICERKWRKSWPGFSIRAEKIGSPSKPTDWDIYASPQ